MTKLEELRVAKGLTQEMIASKVGIAISTYSMYENGHRCIPNEVAGRIAETVGANLEDIFLPEKFTVSKTCGRNGAVTEAEGVKSSE